MKECSCFYNIIIEEQCASRVVAPIIEGLSGSNIQQNNSFLLNKKGEKIFNLLKRCLKNKKISGKFAFEIGASFLKRKIISN